MKKVLILSGIPGSGKSYYTKQAISKANGEYVVCSADHYFENIAKQKKMELQNLNDPEADKIPEYLFDFSKLRSAHIECQQKFIYSLENEIPLIIVDNTNITNKERHFYISAALQHGYEVEVKAFPKDQASIELAAKRNQHGVPLDKIQQRALLQDLDAGLYKIELDPSDTYGKKYKTTKIIESIRYIKKSKLSMPSEVIENSDEVKPEKSCETTESCASLSEISNTISKLETVTKTIIALKASVEEIEKTSVVDVKDEKAKAFSDIQSACDLILHHIEDLTLDFKDS